MSFRVDKLLLAIFVVLSLVLPVSLISLRYGALEKLVDVFVSRMVDGRIRFDYANVRLDLAISGFSVRFADVNIVSIDGNTELDISSLILWFTWMSPTALSEVQVEQVIVRGNITRDFSTFAPLVFWNSGSPGSSLSIEVYDTYFVDQDYLIDKLNFLSSDLGKTLLIHKKDARIDVDFEDNDLLCFSITGWPVVFGDQFVRFNVDFALSPISNIDGERLFKVNDLNWGSLKGGEADLVVKDHEIHLSDIRFVDFNLLGDAFYAPAENKAVLSFDLAGIPFLNLMEIWPEGINPDTKSWLLDNIIGGDIAQFHLEMSLEDSHFGLVINSDFTKLSMLVDMESGKKCILAINGDFSLADDQGTINVWEGKFDHANITEGLFKLKWDDLGEIEANFTGRAKASLADAGAIWGMTFDAEEINAKVTAEFDLDFFSNVQNRYKIYANLEEIKIPYIGFEGDDIKLQYLDGKLLIEGNGRVKEHTIYVQSVDLTDDWMKFSCKGKFRLTDEAILGNIGGAVDAVFDLYYPRREGLVKVEAALDMRDTTFSFDYFGWNNDKSKVAKAKLSLHIRDGGGLDLTKFLLTAEGIDIVGEGSITDEMMEISCSSFKIGDDSLSLTYTKLLKSDNRKVSGILKFHGHVITLNTDFNGFSSNDMIIRGDIDKMIAKNGVVLNGVLFRSEPGLSDSFLTAKFVGGKSLFITYSDGKGLDMHSQDAGLVMQALDITNSLRGGELILHVAPLSGGANGSQGDLFINDFSLVDAPLLAQVLSVASLQDIASTLRGQGIAFDKLSADFVYSDNSIKFSESWMEGGSLGISFKGTVDLVYKHYGFSGEVVPFYAINKIFSDIPIFGRALSGGAGRGIFSVDYSVSSDTEEKDVNIDILSIFAPKIFKLFARRAIAS